MAARLNGNGADYRGLSTDVKPTDDMVELYSIYLELDTGDFYYFDGETWNKIGG
jgi:hypothetical protein